MIDFPFFYFLSLGSLLGLTSGLSPGPLLTLAITETLKYGKKEGIKVTLSPLITDIIIIVITLFFLVKISKYNIAFSIISFCGSIFVAYLAYDTLKSKEIDREKSNLKVNSMKKAIATNFLNPHPYLFWLTVGTPAILKAYKINIILAFIFILSFYIMLIGSKIFVVFVVDRSKKLLNNILYPIIFKIIGIVLIVISILLFKEGIIYLFKK